MAFSNGGSRASGRVSARAGLKGLILLALVAVALVAPRAAEASEYVWKDVEGSWNDAGNWEHVPLSGPIGLGYPNLPGDRALFTGTYASAHNVAVPDGVVITVGTIIFGDHGITIRGDGSGRLRLDNGTFVPQIIRIGVPLSSLDLFDIPVELRKDVNVTSSDASANMVMLQGISNNGGAFGITKKGPGRLYLRGNNSYLGTTSVERGALILDQPDGSGSIEGNLEIGSGVAGPDVIAEVLVAKSHQISNTSRVLIKSQGLLTVENTQRVGEVIVNDGFLTVRNNGFFRTADLTLSGGIVDCQADGFIRLDGRVTATSSAKGPSRIFRSGGGGVLDLGSATDTFIINDGPSTAHDLSIDLPISGSVSAGVVKDGSGTLRLTGSNTYVGLTSVNAGALWLEPLAGGQSISGAMGIGGQGNQPT